MSSCWVSSCWVASCWVALRWMSFWWVFLCEHLYTDWHYYRCYYAVCAPGHTVICNFCLCHSAQSFCSVILLSVFTLSTLYWVTLLFWMHHAERRDAECIVCMLIDIGIMLKVMMLSVLSLCWVTLCWMSWCWVCSLYAECLFLSTVLLCVLPKCDNAEWHYGECRNEDAVLLSAILPECRGAIFTRLPQCPIWKGW